MIIGTFRSVNDDGYIGHLVTLTFGTIPLVFIPTKSGPGYEAVLVGPDDDRTIKIGSAQQRRGASGGYLEVTLDCPGLESPIRATMKLKASREGTYLLEWTRAVARKRRAHPPRL